MFCALMSARAQTICMTTVPGPQAAGTAETLQELGGDLGLEVAVLDLMGDNSNADGNVSSSEVPNPMWYDGCLLPEPCRKRDFVLASSQFP